MRRLIFFALLFQFYLTAFAQRTGQARIDSIRGEPGFKKNDTGKVVMLIEVSRTQLYLDPHLAIAPAREALELSKILQWRRGEANSLNSLGLVVGDTGDNTAARNFFQQALAINRTDSNYFGVVTNFNNIARTYTRQSNYPVALDTYLQGLKIAEEKKNDELISLLCTGLLTIFSEQQNYVKAREYGRMAIEHGEKAHAMSYVGGATVNLGYINMTLGDTIAAREYFIRAQNIFRDLGNLTQEAIAMEDRAELDMNHPATALVELLEVRKIYDAVSPRMGQSLVNLANIGMCFDAIADSVSSPVKKKLFRDSALRYLNLALRYAQEAHNKSVELQILEALSLVEEGNHEPALALRHYKRRTELSDSLYSQEKKNQIAGLQGKHDLELKDKEIAISKLEVNNQHLLVNAQKKTQIGLLIGLLLLATIGAMLFRQSRQRAKTSTTLVTLNSQLDEANKVKARFFGILSHDLRGPISNLLSFLHLVKNEPALLTAEEQNSHEQEIGRSAAELLDTMESILLWSKEQMDDFKPDIRLVPVADLFSYLGKFFGSDQRAQIRFSNPLNLSVSADENYLRVIMQNLTANALKALSNSPDGLVEWLATSDGSKTILAIKDNGPGLNKEQAKALYQDGPGVNARTGFGFHLIRDLAKAIRYNISVDSTPGLGTTFTLAA